MARRPWPGEVALEQSDPATACRYFESSLSLARELDSPDMVKSVLEELALLFVRVDRAAAGAFVLSAAEAIRAELGVDQAEIDDRRDLAYAEARATLGDAFEAQHELGRLAGGEHGTLYALAEIDAIRSSLGAASRSTL